MKLINYDFYDLHALLTFFRNNPQRSDYSSAIKAIIEYIDSKQTSSGTGSNTIRILLQPYVKNCEEELSWVVVENRYTANDYIIKNDVCYKIISSILKELVSYLDNNPERVRLLCDASHNIPLVLVDDKQPTKAINYMLREYRKCYNPEFLCEELKRL